MADDYSPPPSPTSPVCYFDFDSDYKRTKFPSSTSTTSTSPKCKQKKTLPSLLSETLNAFPKPPLSPLSPRIPKTPRTPRTPRTPSGLHPQLQHDSRKGDVNKAEEESLETQSRPIFDADESSIPPTPASATFSVVEEQATVMSMRTVRPTLQMISNSNSSSESLVAEPATPDRMSVVGFPVMAAASGNATGKERDGERKDDGREEHEAEIAGEDDRGCEERQEEGGGAKVEGGLLTPPPPAGSEKTGAPDAAAADGPEETAPSKAEADKDMPPTPSEPSANYKPTAEDRARTSPPATPLSPIPPIAPPPAADHTPSTALSPLPSTPITTISSSNIIHRSDISTYSQSHITVIAASSAVGTESVLYDLTSSARGVSVAISGSPDTNKIVEALNLCVPTPQASPPPTSGESKGILLLSSNYASPATFTTAVESFRGKHAGIPVSLITVDEDLTIGPSASSSSSNKRRKRPRGLSAYFILCKIAAYVASTPSVTLSEARDAVEEVMGGLGGVSVVVPKSHSRSASSSNSHSGNDSIGSVRVVEHARSGSVASIRSNATYPYETGTIPSLPSTEELVKAMVSLLLDRSGDGTSYVDARRGDKVVVFVTGGGEVEEVAVRECGECGVVVEAVVEDRREENRGTVGFGVLRLPRVRRGVVDEGVVMGGLEDGVVGC